ncbi:hypothetical protein [Chryseobacterium koreense]|uniref:Uncharacterized protein n=2 Tax=Chryseobacterium koreense TaxID=232216 RepID=A0A0J7LMA6_9FLAO|nr:hypothetical protein [Chryseobacterium koreense]KMQ70225.1 hypothetical protein ACM44_13285 [Chryseobacterium koreense CCUG 49689]
MRTFIAKHAKTGLKITFKFGLNGVLQIVEFEGEWEADKIKKVASNITASVEDMHAKMRAHDLKSGWIFAELSDVSFANFYKQYPRKVGPKEVTEKAWNKLGNVDKMEAILFIPELVKLKSDGTAFPYPASYLNKKYWK